MKQNRLLIRYEDPAPERAPVERVIPTLDHPPKLDEEVDPQRQCGVLDHPYLGKPVRTVRPSRPTAEEEDQMEGQADAGLRDIIFVEAAAVFYP